MNSGMKEFEKGFNENANMVPEDPKDLNQMILNQKREGNMSSFYYSNFMI